jgi:hypothetical protein
VLSGRGPCDELITRPEKSYRMCCVVVCDLETSRIGAPYIYDISHLRVKGIVYSSLKCSLLSFSSFVVYMKNRHNIPPHARELPDAGTFSQGKSFLCYL